MLHTGDMRWQPSMGAHPALRGQHIDLLFMDTTYGSPKHVHPPQARPYPNRGHSPSRLPRK